MNKPIKTKKEKPTVDEELPHDHWIDEHSVIRLSLSPKRKKLVLEWMEWPEMRTIAECRYTLAEARLLYAVLGCHIKELESR